jgi:hypothetical protein
MVDPEVAPPGWYSKTYRPGDGLELRRHRCYRFSA